MALFTPTLVGMGASRARWHEAPMASTTIDLSALPPPSLIEVLDYEAIVDSLKADLVARVPALAPVMALESDLLVKLVEVVAFHTLNVYARVNDGGRAVLLATASGADLENLGALFGVTRRVLVPANPLATPPIVAVFEGDAELRARIVAAPAGLSVAGPRSSYVFHAKAAHPDVLDVAVTSPPPAPGIVDVVILSRQGNGAPGAELLSAVETYLAREEIRPLTDQVVVRAANLIPVTIEAVLTLFDGPSAAPVVAAANAALDEYLAARKRLGSDITISGLHAALHQPGVQRVTLMSPVANVVVPPDGCAAIVGRTITVGGRDD